MLTDRYAAHIRSVLSCLDRILIQGTLPDICHARVFTSQLARRGLHVSDFP